MAQVTESNPFATRYVRPGAIPFTFPSDSSLESVIDDICKNRLSLIIGPHGSGKSTLIQSLLASLESRFATVQRVQLHACDDDRFLRRLQHQHLCARQVTEHVNSFRTDGSHLLIIDGIEQLHALSCWQLVRLANRLGHNILATSHAPIKSFQIAFETQPNAELIYSLTERVLESSGANIRENILQALRATDLTKVSDVRSLWFNLYDRVADLASQHDRSSSN